MNQLTPKNVVTMSSRDIADLVESRHDDVKRSIERLAERGIIQLPPMADVKNHLNQSVSVYLVGKRDSYVVVAQLSPEFTARLVDRWQELEAGISPAIPQTFSAALRLAAELEEEKQRLSHELAVAAPKVPEELDRTILNLLKDEVVMRQEATTITVGGANYKKLVNLGGTASGWVGETDARPETAASKLGQIEPFMGEIYGNPQATQTMLDDAFFNVEDWINSELAVEFSEQEEIAFTSGNGTKKPKGFLAYASSLDDDKTRAFGTLQHILSGAAAGVTADAIIKLVYTLRKVHRNGAKFMMNNNSLFAVRILKDSEGNYLWRPGLELGQPSSLAGYGVAENEQMPDIAADAKAIAFGNFKRGYTIVDRIGTRILRDPYTNKPFVGFYTTKRTGGMLADSQAIKLLQIGAGA